jgi:hypothetical protein
MAELPHGLRGRDAELDRLMSVLRRAPEQGSAIVLSSEPGVGKSSLIEELGHRARAAGMQTLTAAGVETEAHLPLSGLHQLLRPVLAGASELPLPQRDALESAFGLVAGGAPDLFLIALASLSLLSDAANREPLLVVVEDAHWLDRATAEALAFVGRRLQSDPVVLLVVVREERDTPFGAAGLAQMRLERLPRAAAAQLLDDQHPGLDRHVRQRVLELSLGNPLALSELPRALAPEQLTGGRELPAELPLSSHREHTFATRVAELAPGCQTALLVAALNDADLLGETLHAANLLSGDRVSRDTLGPARLSGLVELAGDGITFRHPLIRSAIRQAASDAERRAGYAALAEAVDGDPDRRAWHRAAAVGAPDEVWPVSWNAPPGELSNGGASRPRSRRCCERQS